MSRCVVERAKVFNGRRGARLERLDLLVEGDRIADIGPPGTFAALEDAVKRIDGSGKTVLPGLIDCHVHLFLDSTPTPAAIYLTEPSELTMIRAVKNCRQHLEAGVTTARDLGAKRQLILTLQKAIDAKLIRGPRILASGEPITIPGGAGDYMGIEVEGVEAVERVTRTLAQSGVQVIKIMNTGTLHNPHRPSDIPQFSEEEVRACTSVAKGFGIRVAAHAHGGDGIKNAILGGVNDVSHGVYLDGELAQLMIDHGCYLVPTVSSGLTLLEHIDHPAVSQYTRSRAAKVTELRLANLARAIEMGVQIASGSDDGTEWNPHGNLSRELFIYVELGMSPDQAIASATSVAAACIGLSDEIGVVDKRRVADLMLVEGDPLEDIQVLNSPWMVMQAGRVVHSREGKREE